MYYLKERDVIVVRDTEIVLRVRHDATHFNFLPVVRVRLPPRYAQLNCPPRDVRVTEAREPCLT